jgi:Uma2 family endonuclease
MATAKPRLSEAEIAQFLREARAQGRKLEYINGEWVEATPSFLHGYLVGLLTFFLIRHVQERALGYVLVETRYRQGDDHVIPDVSFVAQAQPLPSDLDALTLTPDLVVEVQSEGQSERFLLNKALAYLAHVTRMVWLIYPEKGLLEVLTPEGRALLTRRDTLEGGDVMRDFRLPLNELFPAPR